MKHVVTAKPQMNSFARKVARSLRGGDVLALEGTLGAGKTYFTQQLAKALGVPGAVTSPTFVLMNVYATRNKRHAIRHVVHIDCYRLDDPQELVNIGVTDWIGRPDTVVVIEWADKVRGLLRSAKKKTITFAVKGNTRTVSMK